MPRSRARTLFIVAVVVILVIIFGYMLVITLGTT
jgi:hypothetical protein